MTVFRIAHLTDLHFGRVSNWENTLESAESGIERVKELLRYSFDRRDGRRPIFYPSTFNPDVALGVSNWLAQELPYLDVVLVTGDLATTGDEADLELALKFFCGQIPSEWAPVPVSVDVTNSGVPLIMLPGNHDRFENFQPRSQRFETVFGKHWDLGRSYSFPVVPPIGECGRVRLSNFHIDGSYLGILCADLSLESASSGRGKYGFIGQGQAAPKIIEELVAGTNAARAELSEMGVPFGIVWAVHFPPAFPLIPENLSLLQSDDLLKSAADCKVSHILCGHTHKTLKYESSQQAGLVTIICSGASAGISAHGKYAVTVLEIEVTQSGETLISPQAFSWNDNDFVPDDVFPEHP